MRDGEELMTPTSGETYSTIGGVVAFVVMVILIGCTDPASPPIPTTDRPSDGWTSTATAQSRFDTLNDALAAGDVVLDRIQGNGSSSGMALTASLRNTTNVIQQLSVRLSPALYLRPATSSAQNMLATEIYRASGEYFLIDEKPVIKIQPRETTSVMFNGYCVNFEKDNPSEADSFTIAQMPSWLVPIASRITSYERSQGRQDDESVVLRAQVALWLAQGHNPEEIRSKFNASDADFTAAASLDDSALGGPLIHPSGRTPSASSTARRGPRSRPTGRTQPPTGAKKGRGRPLSLSLPRSQHMRLCARVSMRSCAHAQLLLLSLVRSEFRQPKRGGRKDHLGCARGRGLGPVTPRALG